MADLFNPPPIFNLPLVKGQALVVDFKNKTPGSVPAAYVAYQPGTTVSMIIETTPATEAVATISDYHAVCRVEAAASDAIAKGLKWRVVITLPGPPPTPRVPTNGVTVRYDGASR